MEERLSREMLESLVEIQFQLDKLEFKEMLDFLVTQAVKVLKVERCSIFRVYPEIETAYLMAGEPKGEHGIGMKFSFSELEVLKNVVESKSYMLISDVWNDNRTRNTRELIYYKDIKAMLLVALVVGGEVVAVLAIDATKQKKTFTEEEICFSQILANQVSLLLERDMTHKEKEEKEALVILGQAAAEAAHRFKNPLMVIGGYARRLTKLDNSPWFRNPLQAVVNFIRRLIGLRKDYAERIVVEVEKLEKMVNALLNFSGPKRQKLVEVDINKTLREVEKSVIALTDEEKIQIDLQLSPDSPVIIGDPAEIKEIFSPILRNAVEAIKEKGKILVKSRAKDGSIKVSITNTGGCVNDKIVHEIFNPFFTTKQEASGLGLAVVNAVVRAYGGEIKVENDEQLNLTTFVVKLPIN